MNGNGFSMAHKRNEQAQFGPALLGPALVPKRDCDGSDWPESQRKNRDVIFQIKCGWIVLHPAGSPRREKSYTSPRLIASSPIAAAHASMNVAGNVPRFSLALIESTVSCGWPCFLRRSANSSYVTSARFNSALMKRAARSAISASDLAKPISVASDYKRSYLTLLPLTRAAVGVIYDTNGTAFPTPGGSPHFEPHQGHADDRIRGRGRFPQGSLAGYPRRARMPVLRLARLLRLPPPAWCAPLALQSLPRRLQHHVRHAVRASQDAAAFVSRGHRDLLQRGQG